MKQCLMVNRLNNLLGDDFISLEGDNVVIDHEDNGYTVCCDSEDDAYNYISAMIDGIMLYKCIGIQDTDPKPDYTDFLKMLERIKTEMLYLSEHWEICHEPFDPILTKAYPFQRSFDEVAYAVLEWYNDIEAKAEEKGGK